MSKKILLVIAALLGALPIALMMQGQSPQLPQMERTKFPKDAADEAMFLVIFGEKAGHPQDWSGEIAVANGELENLRAYKFEPQDRIEPPNRWRIAKRTVRTERSQEDIYFPGGYRGEVGVG